MNRIFVVEIREYDNLKYSLSIQYHNGKFQGVLKNYISKEKYKD